MKKPYTQCGYCGHAQERWGVWTECEKCGRSAPSPDWSLTEIVILILCCLFGFSLYFSLNGISVIDFVFRGKNVF